MSEFRVWTSFRLGRLALISGHYKDNEAFMIGRNMAARTECFWERAKRAFLVRFATFCEEMNAREAPSMEPKKPLSVTNAKRRSHIIPNSLNSGENLVSMAMFSRPSDRAEGPLGPLLFMRPSNPCRS